MMNCVYFMFYFPSYYLRGLTFVIEGLTARIKPKRTSFVFEYGIKPLIWKLIIHKIMSLYSSFIERLLSTATPNNDSKNDNDERINITKESECKYKRINRCLITSN